jgi:Zn-dependent M16 (insulinase) family peptidase
MSTSPEPGSVVHGFRILRRQSLPEPRVDAVEALHVRSGARLLHLAADDAENLFAVAFATPPADSTGVAHIIEHAVLAGSRRFPVKDPFTEMLKSSMATYLNACTCADRTLYPVASNVAADFFNLAEVYLDAVLHPLISRDTFMQEGWHWAVEGAPGGRLRPLLRGVVLNEMRGAFSDLDTRVERESIARLFPEGTYGHDAGGEPHCIPDLTLEAFTAYYERRYQPGNAHFFLYGNIPLAEKLRFLDERLGSPGPALSSPPVLVRQSPWSRPRRAHLWQGSSADDDADGSAAATLSWLIGDLRDPETDVLWELLDRLLLGDDAAPLRRRLLESGIGTDMTCWGYGSDALQTTFQVGLKGGTGMPSARFEPLVMGALREIAAAGFSRERVRDTLRQIEYSHRDIDSGFPLQLMEVVFSVWLYGLDPLAFLHLDPVLARLQRRLERDPDTLSRLIRRHLLDNPHRLTLVLRPQSGRPQPREQRLTARVRSFRRGLTDGALERLGAAAAGLEDRQSRPNSPAALATLPRLHLGDLPREPAALRSQATPLANGTTLLRQEVACNGVSYFTLALDLSDLPVALLPYVPAYAAFLTRLGTRHLDYSGLSEALTRSSGGLAGSVHVSPRPGAPGAGQPFLVLQGKTLDSTCEEAVSLVGQVLDDLQTVPNQRFREVLIQHRARLFANVIAQGHHLASLQAASHLSACHHLSNLWKGPPQLALAQAWTRATPGSAEGLAEALTRLRDWVSARAITIASFTGTDVAGAALQAWLSTRSRPAQPLPGPLSARPLATPDPVGPGPRLGLAYDIDVAFCARALPAPCRPSPAAPWLQLCAQILSYDYLWEEIRAKGGAYGAFCSYDPGAGGLVMASHSDPDIARTVRVFDGLQQALERAAWTPADIERAAIACARDEEVPIRPGLATDLALWRWVTGVTQEVRRAWRLAQIQATPAVVRQAALEMVRHAADRTGTAVLSSRARLRAAAADLPAALSVRPLTAPFNDPR